MITLTANQTSSSQTSHLIERGKAAEVGREASPASSPAKRRPLPAPRTLRDRHPLSPRGVAATLDTRAAIRRILRREDPRLLVVVGPCSIHDPLSALEYARRLAALQSRVSDHMLLVMRVYLEKPRTTIGWRGLLSDPHLDGTSDMYEGLHRSRALLQEITDLGVPAATEVLDLHAANYLSDAVAFAAIGARTTESQPHRALASGLPAPVGFKNGTDGSLQIALDALVAARANHNYLGTDDDGYTCEIETDGNPDTLLILRGGKQCGPNYGADAVQAAEAGMERLGFVPSLMVDCSHANSGYDPARQMGVCESIAGQKRNGNRSLVGIMIESHLNGGKQALTPGGVGLRYGVSVTDACVDWGTTEDMLTCLAASL